MSSHAAAPAVRRPGLSEALRSLRHRDFALFWSGALISNMGSWMQNITVPFVLYGLTHKAIWVGAAGFVQLFPSVVLGPLAGALADRFQRRSVLMISNSVQIVLALALWAAWVGHFRSPWLLLLLVGLGGAAFGATMPSWQGFVSELVPREDLLNAVTTNSAQFNTARALGPAIGGLILGRFGPSWAFLFNALSFVAVITALALVRVGPAPRASRDESVLAQFRQGLRFVRATPGVLVAIATISVATLLGSPIVNLATVFARDVYGVGAGSYGILAGAYGLGAVVAAGLLASVGAFVARSTVLKVGLVSFGVALVAFALNPVYVLGVVLLGLNGAAFVTIAATLMTTVQLQVTEQLRGRVLALYMMAFSAGMPIGVLAQGALADRFGAPATVAGAGILLVAVGVVAACRPALAGAMDSQITAAEALVSDLGVEADLVAGAEVGFEGGVDGDPLVIEAERHEVRRAAAG